MNGYRHRIMDSLLEIDTDAALSGDTPMHIATSYGGYTEKAVLDRVLSSVPKQCADVSPRVYNLHTYKKLMAADEDNFILLSSVAICLRLLLGSLPKVPFYGCVVSAVAAANGT